jgi:hypothetical protein
MSPAHDLVWHMHGAVVEEGAVVMVCWAIKLAVFRCEEEDPGVIRGKVKLLVGNVVGGLLVGVRVIGGLLIGVRVIGGLLVGVRVIGGLLVGVSVIGGLLVGVRVMGGSLVGVTVIGGSEVGVSVTGGSVVPTVPLPVALRVSVARVAGGV